MKNMWLKLKGLSRANIFDKKKKNNKNNKKIKVREKDFKEWIDKSDKIIEELIMKKKNKKNKNKSKSKRMTSQRQISRRILGFIHNLILSICKTNNN